MGAAGKGACQIARSHPWRPLPQTQEATAEKVTEQMAEAMVEDKPQKEKKEKAPKPQKEKKEGARSGAAAHVRARHGRPSAPGRGSHVHGACAVVCKQRGLAHAAAHARSERHPPRCGRLDELTRAGRPAAACAAGRPRALSPAVPHRHAATAATTSGGGGKEKKKETQLGLSTTKGEDFSKWYQVRRRGLR